MSSCCTETQSQTPRPWPCWELCSTLSGGRAVHTASETMYGVFKGSERVGFYATLWYTSHMSEENTNWSHIQNPCGESNPGVSGGWMMGVFGVILYYHCTVHGSFYHKYYHSYVRYLNVTNIVFWYISTWNTSILISVQYKPLLRTS